MKACVQRWGVSRTKRGVNTFSPHLIIKDPKTPSGPEVSEEQNHPEGVQNAHFKLKLHRFAYSPYLGWNLLM